MGATRPLPSAPSPTPFDQPCQSGTRSARSSTSAFPPLQTLEPRLSQKTHHLLQHLTSHIARLNLYVRPIRLLDLWRRRGRSLELPLLLMRRVIRLSQSFSSSSGAVDVLWCVGTWRRGRRRGGGGGVLGDRGGFASGAIGDGGRIGEVGLLSVDEVMGEENTEERERESTAKRRREVSGKSEHEMRVRGVSKDVPCGAQRACCAS